MNKQQSYHHYISWMNGDLVVTASLKGVQRSIVDHLHLVLVKTRHRELFYNTQLHGFMRGSAKSDPNMQTFLYLILPPTDQGDGPCCSFPGCGGCVKSLERFSWMSALLWFSSTLTRLIQDWGAGGVGAFPKPSSRHAGDMPSSGADNLGEREMRT